jgi:hypothetical protein
MGGTGAPMLKILRNARPERQPHGSLTERRPHDGPPNSHRSNLSSPGTTPQSLHWSNAPPGVEQARSGARNKPPLGHPPQPPGGLPRKRHSAWRGYLRTRTGSAMGSKSINAWKRAARMAALAEEADTDEEREYYTRMRDAWITLANRCEFMPISDVNQSSE